MRTYDFSPLWRSTIGFDRVFDLAEMAHRAGEDNYPPYNIERLEEDHYQISLAVAGFSRTKSPSPPSTIWSRSKAARPRLRAANFFTKGFPGDNSSANLALPTMCR